ncbi:MAG: 30S ribosomal protein S12 methylthiotransferase RimO [Thermodesulfovibrionales bacterium]|nr:30S ribosomal protein S12 methylthiotransferase RimO [Thermodesulfovibrionales bacterium]
MPFNILTQTRFHIITLGCPKNTVDSGDVKLLLESSGFIHTEINDADFILINTCCFIDKAKEESINEILSAVINKQSYQRVVVFGCLTQRYRDEILNEIPEIDAIFGVAEGEQILQYLQQSARNTNPKKTIFLPSNKVMSYEYIKIADGCDRACTFCVIPSIRGRFRSIHKDRILKKVLDALEKGIKEIILIGQDITEYGKDLNNYRLVDLLNDITAIDADFRLRLMYLNPTGIDDNLIDIVAKNDKIIKYLDIPMQHSEDRLLRLMGRRGSRKEYLKLIRNIRKKIPGVTLRTTFIVGFPTETQEDFNSLIDFIEEVRFDRVGTFEFSPQENTKAYNLKGQVPKRLKVERYDTLMGVQAEISYEKNKEYIGRIYDAVVDDIDENSILARLDSQAPEIDGATIIDLRNEVMPFDIQIGSRIKVKIKDCYEYDLLASIVKSDVKDAHP